MEGANKPDLAIKIVGPTIIAVAINGFFYGLCLLQFVKYFRSGVRDSLLIKLFVSWELLLDTFQTAISLFTLWKYAVDNLGNEAFLVSAHWYVSITAVVGALSGCPIQIYLSCRVKKLSSSWMPFTVLLAAITTQGGLLIALSATALQQTKLSEVLSMATLAKCWAILEAATNAAISGCLVFYLRKRLNPGIRRTDHVISRLVRQAIETASIASLFSILFLISYLRWPDTLICNIFGLPLGRVYTNACLVIINSRPRLRKELRGHVYPMEDISDGHARDSLDSISELTRLTTEIHESDDA